MNWSSASTRSRLRTGYSTKSSRLVALVMRMERISLSLSSSLSFPLPLSHSLIRPDDHSHRRLLRQITKIRSRKCTKETGSSAHRRPNQPLPAKKIFFLPSRDHQKLDLDAMCLDLESSRLPNQELPGRGNVASIHQHPPTHYFPFHPSHRTTSTPSIRRTPPKRSPTPLSHPPSSLPPSPLPPPNLAKNKKCRPESKRMANLFSDRIFETKTHKRTGWTAQNRIVGQESRHSTAGVMHNA